MAVQPDLGMILMRKNMFSRHIRRLIEHEDGATAIEYALIIVATAIALIAVMPSIGSGLQNIFNSIVSGWV